MSAKQELGVIGLGVMGQNLALNIERNGYSVAAYDIEPAKVRSSRERFAGRDMVVAGTLADFLDALEDPQIHAPAAARARFDFELGMPRAQAVYDLVQVADVVHPQFSLNRRRRLRHRHKHKRRHKKRTHRRNCCEV
jgi:3-hydroxyacyl-CoA dehydrogenase